MLKKSPKNLLIFFGPLIVVVLAVFVLWPIFPQVREFHSLKLASGQAIIFRERFKHDPRFRLMQFIGTFNREDKSPCLIVSGPVFASEDFCGITNAVESVGCPLEIIYNLENSNQFFSWSDRGGKKPYLLHETHLP